MRSGITRDCLKCMGKVSADRERFNMVVIFGRIVAETCFMRKVGIGLRSHCLLGEACKSLAISSIDAGGNDDKTFGVRVGLKWGGMVEGLDECLRRRVDTLSEKLN